MNGFGKALMGVICVSIDRTIARKISSGLTAMALAAIVLLVAAGSVSALPACSAPGDTNIAASCELDQNWPAVAAGEYGYRITADDVVIDGKGYTLTGTVSGDTCLLDINDDDADESHPANHAGIHIISRTNVTVKDLKVTKFCTGIALKRGVDCTITGCLIDDNGRSDQGPTHGIHVVGSDHCDITKNEISNQKGVADMGDCGSGGNGISFFGGGSPAIRGDYLNVTCNYIHDIAKCGLHSKKKCEYSIIENNRVENCKAGIMPECKQSNWATIRYNNISGMSAYGFYTRGSNNTIQYNTITGTQQVYGIRIISDTVEGFGKDNEISNNSVCGSTTTDILVAGGLADTTDVNDNTCDTSSGGTGNHCPWNCNDPVSVYYDYDGDGFYSNDPENCVCANAMNTGSCCNPGLFNQTHASMLNASSICWLTAGTDPCDCDPAYILNWMTYPYSIWEDLNWSGPAAMEMMINHYTTAPSQLDLDTEGRGNNHNCNSGLQYVDRYGMRATLNAHLYPALAHYGNHITTDVENALHYICWWQSLGPGAVPAYTDYSNWMVVRGIHTDINPRDGSYYPPYGYTIYGFWINDPNPAGIGENSYKCVNQFTDNYYQAMQGQCDVADGNWVSICEPPEVDAEITLANSPARFEKAITPVLAEKMLMVYDAEQLVLEKAVKDDEMLKIVEAAINGVNVELVPYDTEFAATFAKTTAGEPILVTDDGDDYYLVPFNVPAEEKTIKKVSVKIEKAKTSGLNKLERLERVDENVIIEPIAIEPIKPERTLVVVLVNAEEGSFKEASWVSDPVKYLPVSKVEALKLALGEMDITAKEELSNLISKPTIELVYRDVASPYYPDWKITVNGKVFYVGQDGTVS